MKISQLKLICENDITHHNDFEVIVEQKNPSAEKVMKIKGPYIVAETRNINGRIYPQALMEKAVEEYIQEFVKTSRSLGELNHPPTTEVDPERACHLLLDLKQDKNVWIGESRVLVGTPKGDILAGLLNNGVKVGVSSRGVGSIDNDKKVTEYKLIAEDVVWNPSAPNAFVEGILESKNYMIDQHGEVVECVYNKLEQNLSKLPNDKELRRKQIVEALSEFIKAL